MADERDRNKTCHKCCAAALCKNHSDDRKDLIFHAFPRDQSQRKIWMVRMKRSDEKFTSNASLFYCSEHFTSNDCKISLTGSRHDLVRNAVPSIFPWTVDHDKGSERSERANVRDGKKRRISVAGPLEMKHLEFRM